MNKKLFDVCMASLLHDVGKALYRCSSAESHTPHETLNIRIFREVFNFSNYRAYWHQRDIEGNCIVLGDWISAQERQDLESGEHDNPITTPLKTIFSSIKIDEKHCEEKYWKHKKLSTGLPSKDDTVSGKNIHFDKNLFDEFMKELGEMDKKYKEVESEAVMQAFFRELLDLLKKHLSYVPSASYYSESDIDLYNHSKSSCAVSACLYKYYLETSDSSSIFKLKESMSRFFQEKKRIEKIKDDELKKKDSDKLFEEKQEDKIYNDKKLFLLIKGDFSGIQDFVSTISTDKASAHLKARSFYIMYTNKIIPVYIVRELGLPESNIIYSSGGNFEILAHNIEKTVKDLARIQEEVNKRLLQSFGITLFLNIQYKKMSAFDFDREFFSSFISEDNWKNASESSKARKFFGQIKFEPENPAFDLCSICNSDMYDEGSDKKCKNCTELENIRDRLKSWQASGKVSKLESDIFPLPEDNVNLLLYERNITSINKIEGIFELLTLGIPLDSDNKIIDFDAIAKEAEKRTGEKKIGALKVDVDNLGNIFIKGLKDSLTLSRYSRLSFDISMFFDGIVNTIRDKHYKEDIYDATSQQAQDKQDTDKHYKEDIYVIYSGGDDSFIIGAWDKVLDFAKDLMSYFRTYVNMHPGITISAAYGIFSPKYPVKKIFEQLDRDLDVSKSVDGKSCITVLGLPIKWEYFDEFEERNLSLASTTSLSDSIGDMDALNASLRSPSEKSVEEKSFEIFFKTSCIYSSLVKNGHLPRSFLNRSVLLCMDMAVNQPDRCIDISPAWRLEYYLKRISIEDELRAKAIELWKSLCEKQLQLYGNCLKKDKENVQRNREPVDLMKVIAASSKMAQLNSGGVYA